MLSFTVHEAPDAPPDRIDRAEGLVFVKDGFSWTAALFAPIWLIVHRLWLPLLGYVLVSALILWLGSLFDSGLDTLASLALHLLIGFEADALRRWGLERRGWSTIGTVTGRTADECERRFFDMWLPAQPIVATPSTGTVGSAGQPA
jgi:Protein of unknown function (DUF2628)